MQHLGISRHSIPEPAAPFLLTAFEWVYASNAGMFYPMIAAGGLLMGIGVGEKS